jgi:hypothetical protein
LKVSPNIFLSGGIGDIFAIESFIPDEHKDNIKSIYYATQKYKTIIECFNILPVYHNLKNHINVWSDFSKFWCFHHKQGCISKLKAAQKTILPGLTAATDYSIMKIFSEINSKHIKYNKSSWIAYPVSDITHIKKPESYWCVCPYSTDKNIKERDFSKEDWDKLIRLLENSDDHAIILNQGVDVSPIHPLLIDMSNKTTIGESIEILKSAKGYIGIDSCLCVLASKIFQYPNLIIKSMNNHLYNNKHIYFAPQNSFNFLQKELMI